MLLMYLSKLSEQEQEVVIQCMKAILNGDFLKHEFQTRLGISEMELKEVLVSFPDIDDSDDDSRVTRALNNCMNEVCHGIRFRSAEWEKWFTFERDLAIEVYEKWTQLRGWNNSGSFGRIL